MVSTVEPEWDAEDRAILQAAMDLRADQCPGCGEPLSESLRVAGQPDPKYTANRAECVSCEAKERVMEIQEKRDQQDEKTRKVFRSARHWVISRLS